MRDAVSTSANALSPISTYTICFGFAVQQAVQQIHSKLKRLQQIHIPQQVHNKSN